MKARRLIFFVVAALLLVSSGFALARVRQMVRYRFSPGQRLTYHVNLNGKVQMNQGSIGAYFGKLNGNMELVGRVKRVKGNTATIELTAPQLNCKQSVFNESKEVVYRNWNLTYRKDGQACPLPQGTPKSFPLLQKPVVVQVNTQGKIVNSPDLVVLQNSLNNLYLPGLPMFAQRHLPDSEVWDYADWSRQVKQVLPGAEKPLVANTNYSMKGYEEIDGENAARIDFSSNAQANNIKIKRMNPDLDEMETVVINGLSQKSNGTIWISVPKGRIVKANVSVDMRQVTTYPTLIGNKTDTMDLQFTVNAKLKK